MALMVTIDSSGRLVIPKELRDRFHLQAGAQLRVIDEGNRLVLEPVEQEALVAEREGFLIARSIPTGGWLDHRDLRGERLEAVSDMRRDRKK